MSAIRARYNLPHWQKKHYELHKQADLIAAALEAVHCIGWTHDDIRNVLGITQPVLDTDPLTEVYDCEPWMPWPPELAADCFLKELATLMQSTRGEGRQMA